MNRNKWIILSITIIVIFSIIIPIVTRQNQETETIKMGVLLSLTGDAANYGKRSLNGILWAVDKANKQGGINGKPIKLIVEDSGSSPKVAVSAFNKLITVDKVKVVIGDIVSGTTIAVAPIAEKNKILLFAPGASHPSIRDAGDFIFRNWTSDDFDGKAMASYLLQKGVRELSLIVQKTDYTFGLAKVLEETFQAGGGTVNSVEEFSTGNLDLRTQLTKLKISGEQHVYISAHSSETGRVLKQASEIAFKPNWYSTLTVDTPECANIAGSTRDDVIFTTPSFDPHDENPEMREFIDGFSARFGDDPESAAGHAYDAVNILVMVMKNIGVKPSMIKDELYKVKDFPGVTGNTSFDDHGDVVKGIYIKQIGGNSNKLLEYFIP